MYKILVVEDEEIERKALVSLLKEHLSLIHIQEKVMDQDAVDEAVDQENEKKETEEVAVEEQLKALEEEVNTWKTDYYKVFADMENLKRRLQNEHANTMKFMMQSFIEQLLPVVDNFERSLTVENPSEEIKNFLKGYEMIYNQLIDVYKRQSIIRLLLLIKLQQLKRFLNS